ncbi:MAG TPA: NAD(P)-binding domain-containing protein [Propionibacteriaceae bacterium]|nr:NAD(P)-binding domain-containing protein [Propionibacteriaceae bacterium]
MVVGGGQAGLATAKALLDSGIPCVALERHERVGDTWRLRYDSLRLFTPARYDSLPGLRFPGRPDAYPTKDEVADYLERYAARFELPVRTGVRVLRVRPGTTTRFDVETDAAIYHCGAVVVATGTYGSAPRVPDAAHHLDPAILQLHSSEYSRPSYLPEGPVLVVGASHSGCDIAYELAATRPTTLAGPDRGQVPLRWGAWPLRLAWPPAMALGRHVLTRSNPLGRRLVARLRTHGSPMLRVKRNDLAARGVVRIAARVVGVRAGRPLLADGRVLDPRTVIWATGFEQRFDWIDLPSVPARGWPREVRGVAADVPGLYFCGLAFQYSLASGDLAGVGDDARYLAGRIAAQRTRERTHRDPARGGTPA